MIALLYQFMIEIIAAVILVPLALKYGKVVLHYFRNKRFENRMKKVYQIYDEINRLRIYLESPRILLLRTTNGGGLPAPGRALYASIIAEVNGEGFADSSLRNEWQNRLIDHDYIRMLERVYTDGEILNVVADLPEYSLLRGAYEKIGIKKTRVIKLGIHNDGFYYVSIACLEGKKLTPPQRYTIDTAIQNINNLLK